MNIDIIERLKTAYAAIPPVTRDVVVMNPHDFNILFNHLKQQEKPLDFMQVNAVKIYSDPDVKQGQYFICHQRLFEIWLSLKGNCWLQTYDDRITAARILFEAEQQEKERQTE